MVVEDLQLGLAPGVVCAKRISGRQEPPSGPQDTQHLVHCIWHVPHVVQRGVAADDVERHAPEGKDVCEAADPAGLGYYGPPTPDGSANPNYHHTLQDTMDKISARSLQTVGDVGLGLIIDQ